MRPISRFKPGCLVSDFFRLVRSRKQTVKGIVMNVVTEKALALLFAIALSSAGFNTLIV